MANITVRIIYNQGESNEYVLPHVYSISDPEPGMKPTIIKGNRASGSIVIPAGKTSYEINIKGKIVDEDGYNAITTIMNEMRTKITTDLATLKLQHYDSGWVDDWDKNVRRIEEIRFPTSLRTDLQEYEINFYVINP